MIASAIFGYFAWRIHEAGLLIIAISLIGSIVGFLRYNSYPTRVFMGDSGSMMLGYTLAVMPSDLTVGQKLDAENLRVPRMLARAVRLPIRP